MNNLKILFFAGVLLFINLSLSAQKLPVSFGVKTGLNLSNATVNDASSTNIKMGYFVGGTLEYSLTEKFFIQSGILFSAKGSKIYQLNKSDYIPSPIDDTHTFNQLYLTLPLYGAYKLTIAKNFNITFALGPYFGYGIGGKTKQKLNSGSWSDGNTEIEWDTFGNGIYDENRNWLRGTTLKRLDIGAGANIDLEYHTFILGIGFEQGLRNIAVQDLNPGLKYTNSTFQVSIGYKL